MQKYWGTKRGHITWISTYDHRDLNNFVDSKKIKEIVKKFKEAGIRRETTILNKLKIVLKDHDTKGFLFYIKNRTTQDSFIYFSSYVFNENRILIYKINPQDSDILFERQFTQIKRLYLGDQEKESEIRKEIRAEEIEIQKKLSEAKEELRRINKELTKD